MLGRVAGNRGITWVMLGAVALSVYGLWWALPATTEPDPDSSVPLTTLRGASCGFANGWVGQHQPLQPMIIATLSAPYLGYLLVTGGLDRHAVKRAYPYGLKSPEASLSVVILIGRALSAVSYLALVWIFYQIGLLLRGERAGVISAALAATCYPFVYYGHVGNPDMLYTALMAAALLSYLRSLREPSVSNVAVLASAAALAASVKFQALPFLVGMTPAVVCVALKAPGGGSGPGRRPSAHGWRALLVGLVIFGATFAAANNLMFNSQGFVKWVGEKQRGAEGARKWSERQHQATGGPGFGVRTARNLVAGTGLPVLVLAGVGICLGVAGGDALVPALLVPFAAYAAFYWKVHADFIRYMFPCMLVLLVFAALGADAGAKWLARGRVGVTALVLAATVLFCFLGARAVGITWLMTHGSRCQAEKWITSRAGSAPFTVETHQPIGLRLPPNTRVTALDPASYFAARRAGADLRNHLPAGWEYPPGLLEASGVIERAPDVVVLLPGEGNDDQLISDLGRPGTGYTRAAEFGGPTRLLRAPLFTNIPIVIFQRTVASGAEQR
jgi:hypothetical protein